MEKSGLRSIQTGQDPIDFCDNSETKAVLEASCFQFFDSKQDKVRKRTPENFKFLSWIQGELKAMASWLSTAEGECLLKSTSWGMGALRKGVGEGPNPRSADTV
jgi:hypothetical protein